MCDVDVGEKVSFGRAWYLLTSDARKRYLNMI